MHRANSCVRMHAHAYVARACTCAFGSPRWTSIARVRSNIKYHIMIMITVPDVDIMNEFE